MLYIIVYKHIILLLYNTFYFEVERNNATTIKMEKKEGEGLVSGQIKLSYNNVYFLLYNLIITTTKRKRNIS